MGDVVLEMVPMAPGGEGGMHSNAYTGWRSVNSHDIEEAEQQQGSSRAATRRSADGRGGDDDHVVLIDNLHKTYLLGVEGVAALRGVTLKIRRGEFVMLYGTSGGGKSTLLNIIGTIDRPTKGSVRVCGTRITDTTPDARLAELRLNKLGFVFQTFNLISGMTALENVEMPLTLHGSLPPKERRERCESILRSVGMGDRMHHIPSQLSGGEQQRVTIARALVNFPDILLLDEPTGDLDSKNTETVMKMLVELNQQHGITLIMVTHDVHLRQFASRIVHLRDGKLHHEELPDHKKRERAVSELFACGLGSQGGVSRLQEGASLSAELHDDTALTSRGLPASQCSITCVRPPQVRAPLQSTATAQT